MSDSGGNEPAALPPAGWCGRWQWMSSEPWPGVSSGSSRYCLLAMSCSCKAAAAAWQGRGGRAHDQTARDVHRHDAEGHTREPWRRWTANSWQGGRRATAKVHMPQHRWSGMQPQQQQAAALRCSWQDEGCMVRPAARSTHGPTTCVWTWWSVAVRQGGPAPTCRSSCACSGGTPHPAEALQRWEALLASTRLAATQHQAAQVGPRVGAKHEAQLQVGLHLLLPQARLKLAPAGSGRGVCSTAKRKSRCHRRAARRARISCTYTTKYVFNDARCAGA